MIAETAPVSKGEFYRALTKGRSRIASVDDMFVTAASAARLAALQERFCLIFAAAEQTCRP